MKLANVGPVLMKEYRKGEITQAHMMAFAVTDDQALQEKVWNEIPKYQRDSPMYNQSE